MIDILTGLKRFQTEVYPSHRELFAHLAANQQPRALFIACSDSRVVPNLLLQAEPGDLFLVRNAGNIVPPAGSADGGGTVASIEYAVAALDITDVILCGHTNCGAMKGILHPEKVESMPHVAAWVQHATPARRAVERLFPEAGETDKLERTVEQNVIQQVKNLLTHSFIRSRVEAGRMELYGWVYDIRSGTVRGMDASGQEFSEIHFEAHGSPDEKRMLRELEADEEFWERL
ncbi:carbonic anhydrase [uncultured Paludibaculum sp.]|uniref:carbonic anhydrase n=1 Tax=uncultured Paludibaculum sp. TaxID=1765020 RepID=UPI002AAA8330|nr:carbonic anhydrase [uncultured Paludibaculum sp.]